MDFTPVPDKEQADIKTPKRAAWFNALLDHGMLRMDTRPTLSVAQKQTLDEQGMRFRSTTRDEGGKRWTYVWVEDIPSTDLNEAAPVDDDEVPL